MSRRIEQLRRASAGAALLALAACGGGGGGESTTVVVQPPASTTTNVSTTVVDGAIRNAVVCIDKNGNGVCDTGETQGTTDANGNVTLAVPNGDVGKYPIVAMVGTDAIDADHGPVTTAYSMSAPADQATVVSPLTTLVQQTVAGTGATTAEAAKSVQDATGITASLFADFTKVTAPADGTVSAATVARMLVVTTQQQAAAVATTVGTLADDGAAITRADLDKAIQKKLLELLPTLVTALGDPAVLSASTPEAREAALLAAATTLVTSAGLTPDSVATVVAINNQASAPVATTAPAAFIQLANLSYTSASSYVARLFTGSLAQNTPAADNNAKYVERRLRMNGTNLARWGSGSEPKRGADLNWNGSAWVGCPINFENTSSVRDAQGNNVYSYCDKRETGKSNRATFDVAGRTMAEIYAKIHAAGYTNLVINDPTVLGTAVFPDDSKLFYQTNTPLTTAISYYPAGADSLPNTSNVANQFSAAVSAGGVASAQADGTGCNTFSIVDGRKVYERDTNGSHTTNLESMIAMKAGTPCVYTSSNVTVGGVVYTAPEPNAAWGTATASLGVVPAPVGTEPGFYNGTTQLRAAFTGGNAVTYYACKQRSDNGNIRACTSVGSGTFAIATLGDARVMTFANLPIDTAPLNYTRVFVERGGFVYYGYQSKPAVTNVVRLSSAAAGALLTQLGIPVEDPSIPVALTAGSYAGTWDLRGAGNPVSSTDGVTITLSDNGLAFCRDSAGSFSCTVSITDAATGAFTMSDGVSTTIGGSFGFQSGLVTGTFDDPSSTPSSGAVVGGRR